jgi:hypothetical protein
MASVAPVQVQAEDPFAVMEVCRQVIEGVLRRSAAEGWFIPQCWIDVPYGGEEMALLEEEIDQRVRRHRRLIQAKA